MAIRAAVTIERAHDHAPLIADEYELTERERAITRLILKASQPGPSPSWSARSSGGVAARPRSDAGGRSLRSDRCGSRRGTSTRSSSALPRLLPWLDERRPDVVCLQETKLADDAFLALLGDELADRGYEVAVHGEAAWNGVAILSRVGLDDVVPGLAGGPGFPHQEARALSATCGGIRVVSVYVPNGRQPGSEHYEYKLAWLASLRDDGRRRPGGGRGLRRHEHRPHRRRTCSIRTPTSARPT